MRRMHVAVVLLLLSLIAPAAARADQADDYIKRQMAAFHLPGLSLAVVKNGQVMKAQGYGLADIQRRIPMTTQTGLKICSVSKQFIAAGIMLLVTDGRLRLDDPISKYLEGTPPAWAPITIRHLLTHTSGLVRESPTFDAKKDQHDADVIKGAYAVPLRFVPGQRWEYSNTGYYALAETIHKVTGRPWAEFLTERIFMPAGMTATVTTNTKPPGAAVARGYTGNDNGQIADDWLALRPSGAFRSTVLDLARWDAVLYTNRILSESALRQMSTPVQLNDGRTAPYGFGWHVDAVGTHRRVWHGGGLPGFTAQFVRFPDDKLTIIVLANGDDVDTASIANGLAALFYLPNGKR